MSSPVRLLYLSPSLGLTQPNTARPNILHTGATWAARPGPAALTVQRLRRQCLTGENTADSPPLAFVKPLGRIHHRPQHSPCSLKACCVRRSSVLLDLRISASRKHHLSISIKHASYVCFRSNLELAIFRTHSLSGDSADVDRFGLA